MIMLDLADGLQVFKSKARIFQIIYMLGICILYANHSQYAMQFGGNVIDRFLNNYNNLRKQWTFELLGVFEQNDHSLLLSNHIFGYTVILLMRSHWSIVWYSLNCK